MAKLISKTYGEALFELATEENKLDTLFEEVKEISEILDENPELGKLFLHPRITKEEKVSVMESIFKGRISDELTGFLDLVLQKERYRELQAILQYFIDKVKEEKGIGIAYVTTAMELKDAQKRQVVKRLLETTGYREMEMHYSVDKTVIGGMIIRIGDRVVDSTVRTKLETLKKQLYEIQM